jgi:hypothetical protein
MRDIRSDLEERAHIIQEQVRVAYAHFEKRDSENRKGRVISPAFGSGTDGANPYQHPLFRRVWCLNLGTMG